MLSTSFYKLVYIVALSKFSMFCSMLTAIASRIARTVAIVALITFSPSSLSSNRLMARSCNFMQSRRIQSMSEVVLLTVNTTSLLVDLLSFIIYSDLNGSCYLFLLSPANSAMARFTLKSLL